MLDQISINIQGLHTQEADRGDITYAIGASSECRVVDNTMEQVITQLRIEISLFSKPFVILNSKKVKVVGSQDKASRLL